MAWLNKIVGFQNDKSLKKLTTDGLGCLEAWCCHLPNTHTHSPKNKGIKVTLSSCITVTHILPTTFPNPNTQNTLVCLATWEPFESVTKENQTGLRAATVTWQDILAMSQLSPNSRSRCSDQWARLLKPKHNPGVQATIEASAGLFTSASELDH